MQKQIAHSKWPSTYYAPKIAEKFGYMYENKSMTYASYVVSDLNSTETRGASGKIEQILGYVAENLVKVI